MSTADKSSVSSSAETKVPLDVPKKSLDDAPLIPEATANFLSFYTFQWITPLLVLGYKRPLEATDLYKLQDDRGAAVIASKIVESYNRRLEKVKTYNARVDSGEIRPPLVKRLFWSFRGSTYAEERETNWRKKGEGKRRASLAWAMNDSVAYWFWSGGIFKVVGDTAQVTSPLLVKAIINFAKESYATRISGQGPSPPIGRGVGYAFGLLALQLIASLATQQWFYRAASTGVLLRGGLITAIYDRSLNLTGRAKTSAGLSNGIIMNFISTDVSRIDFCCSFFHAAWASPIQLIICIVLLILNLGPAATFSGCALFVVMTPLQTMIMKQLFKLRGKSMKWTDKRARMLNEVLAGLRISKCFAWEDSWIQRIADSRRNELKYLRSVLLIRSANNAVAMAVPALASVLAFVVYSATGHSLDPANVFASLTLFNMLRLPLMFLPMSLSSISDAANATQRLSKIFEAELRKPQLGDDEKDEIARTDGGEEGGLVTDESLDVALRVQAAEWTWEASSPPEDGPKGKKGPPSKGKPGPPPRTPKGNGGSPSGPSENQQEPFRVKDVNLVVPRGQLVAIVGAVGSGKTSLIQGCIGEMRRLHGSVKWGGSIGLCSQQGWIQNATIRENICFGRPFDEVKYRAAIRDSCLEQDLEILTDQAEVGEKGITLSGGQKQRLNLCRTLYCDAEIQIFDDPFSALDAHVGKSVFENAILKNQAHKTRIVITHALHFLPQVDYIYTVVDGRISERGTYSELMAKNGDFARFAIEFGGKEAKEEEKKEAEEEAVNDETNAVTDLKKPDAAHKAQMQDEERNTGAVSWSVYRSYLAAGHGWVILPLVLISLVFIQGAQVMSAYWLVFWQELEWNQTSAFYMGIYAGLGAGQAVAFFFVGCSFAFLNYFASKNLHMQAVRRIMHVPLSWMESQPLGRVMNRFSKDIDNMDNQLGESLRMFWATMSSIIAAIILIAIIVPWFLIAVGVVMAVYIYAAWFYLASAREIKRLDSILRSSLYSHFSESLTGLATIRAYGEEERFRRTNESLIDIENRAYWETVVNQRWLGIRLDFLGSILTFVVAMLTVAARNISPSQTGVALSYILSIQQAFGWVVRQSSEVENNMNSVERVVHYAQEIPQEAPYDKSDVDVPKSWPSKGQITMKDMVLQYRADLPAVLKGITMEVKPGEKVGIVGRTGAGKSSIMTALYRIVELAGGSISIDGVDISSVGLRQLRKGLAIIPQDPLLFSGTVRSNLDPFSAHDDATLWDALRRSYLVESSKNASIDGTDTEKPERKQQKFHLDTPIEDEGSNLSIGQRSLLSLARALVSDSKILILDEATASVDYETDRKIQETITHEFYDRTILCIAHRLRTIISYDRIVCLDAGQIAEFDSPTNLYEKEGGIFRTMCERSSITLDDITLAAKHRREHET